MSKNIPILFACSGCSNAGQLANDLAVEFDRRGIAEMSCLAGVGAGKELFLKRLRDREVWVIDGCPIDCSLGVFDQVREHVDVHIRLNDFNIKKNAPKPAESEFDQFVDTVLDWVKQQPRTVAVGDDSKTPRQDEEGP